MIVFLFPNALFLWSVIITFIVWASKTLLGRPINFFGLTAFFLAFALLVLDLLIDSGSGSSLSEVVFLLSNFLLLTIVLVAGVEVCKGYLLERLVLISFLICLISFVSIHFQLGIPRIFNDINNFNAQNRLVLLEREPSITGYKIFFLMLISILAALKHRNFGWLRLLYVAVAVAFFVIGLLSMSKSALGAILAALMFFFFRSAASIIIKVTAILFIAVAIYYSGIFDYLNWAINGAGSSGSTLSRLTLAKASLLLVSDNPFGLGLNFHRELQESLGLFSAGNQELESLASRATGLSAVDPKSFWIWLCLVFGWLALIIPGALLLISVIRGGAAGVLGVYVLVSGFGMDTGLVYVFTIGFTFCYLFGSNRSRNSYGMNPCVVKN